MRTEDMRAFSVVARTLNLGVAAKRLGVPHTTLADGIRRFEREFADPLLMRTARPPWLTLTELGERVLMDVIEILELEDRMRKDRPARRNRVAVRIGVNESVAHTWLFEWLGRLRQEQPDVELDFRVETTDALDDRCRGGDLDLAVAARALGGPEVHKHQLPSLAMAFVGSARMTRTRSYGLEELAARGLVTFQFASQPYRDLMRLLARERIAVTGLHTASSIPAMVELVERGFGVATLPRRMASRGSHQLGVLPCELGLPPLPVWMSWPEPARSKACQRTVESLQTYARDLPCSDNEANA